MVCVDVFNVVRNKFSVGSDIKMRICPIDPYCKNRHSGNGMSIDMTLIKWAIFTIGVYGKIL